MLVLSSAWLMLLGVGDETSSHAIVVLPVWLSGKHRLSCVMSPIPMILEANHLRQFSSPPPYLLSIIQFTVI